MAIVLVQGHCYGGTGAGPFGGTLTSAPTVGNKLVLASSQHESVRILKITQAGVVWTRLKRTSEGSGTDGTEAEGWFGDVVGPTPSASISIAVSGTTESAFAIHEVSGLRDVWPFDQSGDLIGTVTPANTGTAGIPAVSDSYEFGSIAQNDSTAGTAPAAPTNGFTLREQCEGTGAASSTGHRITSVDKIVASPEAARSRLAYGGSTGWAGQMSTLKGDTEPAKPILPVQQVSQVVTAKTTTITLPGTPTNGNTLLMAVTLRGGASVIGINQDGAAWVNDVAISHANGTIRTEIWRASNVQSASAIITAKITAKRAGGFMVQEFSGVLAASPLDSSATQQGFGNPVRTGQTASGSSSDELAFAAVGFDNGSADFQNAFGFLRTDQDDFSTGVFVMATFITNDTFKTQRQQLVSETGVGGDFAACISVYKNDQAAPAANGPPVGIASAFFGEGGETNPIDTATPRTLISIPSSSFIAGHRYLITASARLGAGSGTVRIDLTVGGVVDADSQGLYRTPDDGTERASPWALAIVRTMQTGQGVTIQTTLVTGSAGTMRQASIVAIDLDSVGFFKNTQWFNAEDSVVQADMDAVFANNVGASLTVTADGTSSYLVLGYANMRALAGTPLANENAMRIRDTTNVVTLAQSGFHKVVGSVASQHSLVGMRVLDTPGAGSINLQIEMIGGGGGSGWEHHGSALTVIKLDQFASSGFAQSSPGAGASANIMPPDSGADDARLIFNMTPDELGEIVTLAYVEADNVADDFAGLALQAQFPGVVRSMCDTEDETLGGTVTQQETNNGNYDTNNAETKVPSFCLSRKGVFPPVLASMFLFIGDEDVGGGSLIDGLCIVSFGLETAPLPAQTAPPDPVADPTVVSVLQEKTGSQREDEALDHLLEQFKP